MVIYSAYVPIKAQKQCCILYTSEEKNSLSLSQRQCSFVRREGTQQCMLTRTHLVSLCVTGSKSEKENLVYGSVVFYPSQFFEASEIPYEIGIDVKGALVDSPLAVCFQIFVLLPLRGVSD